MGDEEDTAAELLDGAGEGAERVTVEVVGGLVHHDDVRLLPHGGAEHELDLLAAGETLDAVVGTELGVEAEIDEVLLDVRLGEGAGVETKARAASRSSTRFMYFSKPNLASFSRSIQVEASMERPFHCTSYSYLDFFWRRERIFSTTSLRMEPSSWGTGIFSFMRRSSSSVYWAVTLVRFSLSSPVWKRQRMYSLGVFSRCCSTWWKACCAT